MVLQVLLYRLHRDQKAEEEAGLQAAEGSQRVGEELSGNPAGRSVHDLRELYTDLQ